MSIRLAVGSFCSWFAVLNMDIRIVVQRLDGPEQDECFSDDAFDGV